MKIYVASSWRNKIQPTIVFFLKEDGHEVYDYRNPKQGPAFHWSDIDEHWETWSMEQFRGSLNNPVVQAGFASNRNAMIWAEACVLVMPCGRSAHLEAGYFLGSKKPLYILLSDGEPELMYEMATGICTDYAELSVLLKNRNPYKNRRALVVKMQENRTAEIWGPRGCWRTADFEDLRKNMVFRLREPGGELVRDDAGNTAFCAMSDPYFNRDRVMTILVRSRMTIFAYGEN